MVRSFAPLFLVAALSGCAGDVASPPQAAADPYQQISVNTPGHAGAHCFLQAGSRSYTTSTPGTVVVFRAADEMDVTCFKGEHMIGNEKVRPNMVAREAERIAAAGGACGTCLYPPLITVSMGLDARSLERSVRHIR